MMRRLAAMLSLCLLSMCSLGTPALAQLGTSASPMNVTCPDATCSGGAAMTTLANNSVANGAAAVFNGSLNASQAGSTSVLATVPAWASWVNMVIMSAPNTYNAYLNESLDGGATFLNATQQPGTATQNYTLRVPVASGSQYKATIINSGAGAATFVFRLNFTAN